MGDDFRHFESLVKNYFANPDIIESYSTVGLFPAEEIIVNRFFRKGCTVLDIGCGAGRTAVALSLKGYSVTGIDIVSDMIEKAKGLAKLHNTEVNFMAMDAGEMVFGEETFENVLSTFNVIDQIPGKEKRGKVFRDIFKICKRGGYFVLASRSGFSMRRLLIWPWIFCVFLLEKYLKGNIYELGDKRLRGEYYHYQNPFYIKRFCKDIGFNLVYFNSEKALVRGRRSNFFANFSGDRMLLYVFEKRRQSQDK